MGGALLHCLTTKRGSCRWLLPLVVVAIVVLPYFLMFDYIGHSTIASRSSTTSTASVIHGHHSPQTPTGQRAGLFDQLSARLNAPTDALARPPQSLDDDIEAMLEKHSRQRIPSPDITTIPALAGVNDDFAHPDFDRVTADLGRLVDDLFMETEADVKASVNALVTVGIKTFNRPACALNLLKTLLFYYPGITVVIVNDGDQPLVIDDKSWLLTDPRGSAKSVAAAGGASAKQVRVDLTVRVRQVDDVDAYLAQDHPLFPRVADSLSDDDIHQSEITIINAPFDGGVSLGRNLLVHSCPTKYLLMTDDDYEFVPETDITLMMRLLEHSERVDPASKLARLFKDHGSSLPIDIVGGIRNEGAVGSSFPRGSNFVLKQEKVKDLPGDLSGYSHVHVSQDKSLNVLRISPSVESTDLKMFSDSTGVVDQMSELMQLGNCLPTEFIQQFFMARVSTLTGGKKHDNAILWDPVLKNNDHYDFFLRARKVVGSHSLRKASVIGCKSIMYQHAKQTNKACQMDTKLPPPGSKAGASYMDFRNRWVQFVPYLFEKWDIGMVIDQEIGKTIVVARNASNSASCQVLELRNDPKKNKEYSYAC